jgi:hypothetical protein
MPRHNIVGCEAVFERGWQVREAAFAPGHGTITTLPRRRPRLRALALALLAFAAGAAAVIAAAALTAGR